MKSKTSRQLHATAAASATPASSTADKVDPVDTGPLLRTLVCRYQQHKRPISLNFRRIFPFLNSADRFTHLIHPYPAKLLVHIPFFFLANDLLSDPGDIVFDPFCGSGTVLLEAQLANRRACGVDANPLARLIAHVKTTPLDAAVLKRTLNDILKRVPLKPSGARPDVVNLEHWFYPSTTSQLQCLQEAIEGVRATDVRDFFLVCFSVCVRRVSLADPRLSVPVRLQFGQYPDSHPFREKSDAHLRELRRVRVTEIFARITGANIARIERLHAGSSRSASVELMCSDARHLVYEYSLNGKRGKPLADESVQLIITSPPYPGAQKYIRSCSLSLGWLRLCPTTDLRAYKAREIGREEFTKRERDRVLPTNIVHADKVLTRIRSRNPVRATIAATYLHDMRLAIREMFRVLKPGGHAVIVAANNHISGMEFRTVDYLRTIAEECGLFLTACFIDAIRSRGLMTKRNDTASVITREWVLIFSKGGVPEWSR
ncbi:MAG: DNA methyltransferase [Terriglobia bacterium]